MKLKNEMLCICMLLNYIAHGFVFCRVTVSHTLSLKSFSGAGVCVVMCFPLVCPIAQTHQRHVIVHFSLTAKSENCRFVKVKNWRESQLLCERNTPQSNLYTRALVLDTEKMENRIRESKGKIITIEKWKTEFGK